MKTTATPKRLRFAQPLRRPPEQPTAITRPFFQTPRQPAIHDMLLLTAHPEFLPAPTQPQTPPPGLTFFNLDRP